MPTRRQPVPPPIEVRRFTPEQAAWAINLLESRIADVKALETLRYDDPKVDVALQKIRGNTLEIFGENSREYREHQYYNISGGDSIAVVGWGDNPGYHEAQCQRDFLKGIPRTITMLGGLIDTVRERTDAGRPVVEAPKMAAAAGNNVFIVHGRKDGPREAVARFVGKFGLNPIILQEQASEGRTLIEKVERHSEEVRFAVVLLTAEDLGGLSDTDPKTFQRRARQNVILELGYFVGKLGRRRVCVLHEEGVEVPSDFHGVVYVPLDGAEAWKLRLAREMKATGLDIDLNLAM